MAVFGPQLANPAFRFEAQQREKLRASGDRKRSQTNRAAAARAPVTLPAWDRFSSMFGTLQVAGAPECLAIARAENKDAYKRLPEFDEHRMLAVVTLKDPNAGKTRGPIPHTQLSGARPAV